MKKRSLVRDVNCSVWKILRIGGILYNMNINTLYLPFVFKKTPQFYYELARHRQNKGLKLKILYGDYILKQL